MCPHCKKSKLIIKRGTFRRSSDHKIIQRFQCKNCLKSFSTQTLSFDYRLKKRHLNQSVFRLLSKGMSQRGCAQVLEVDPKTIARRVTRFGQCGKKHLEKFQNQISTVKEVVFDEMESFEHTKLKPLTIPLAVENGSRRILALSVGKIAAKGLLAEISVKKYGKRKCERKKTLNCLFSQLSKVIDPKGILKSDESHHYPFHIKKFFPLSVHKKYKGRKPAVTGQGEMKKGGFDPLFSLNQTAAMIRDNIKRLSRRTWCTTKRVDRLLDLLHIYSLYHNQRIAGVKRPRIFNWVNTN